MTAGQYAQELIRAGWVREDGPRFLLGNDEVHVWRAVLGVPTTQVQACARLQASDERARAAKFLFERDQSHFVVARGILRSLLSRYLHTEMKPQHPACSGKLQREDLIGLTPKRGRLQVQQKRQFVHLVLTVALLATWYIRSKTEEFNRTVFP